MGVILMLRVLVVHFVLFVFCSQDPANLGHIAKELRESIGRSTGDISILLKVLKDSKFDAVKAVEHGLDRVLVEIVELASEPSIARPAAEILDAIRKVL